MNRVGIGKAVLIGGVLLGLGSRLESEAGAKGPDGVLYFFTTPEAEGAPEGARKE